MGLIRDHGLGQTEVQHLHDAIRPDFDVGGLQVAMHDPQVVRGLERVGNLPGDVDCVGNADRAPRQQVGKRRPFHQLHDQRFDPAAVLESVDVRDVGVIELRERVRFAREAREPVGIGGKRCRQDFDGDVAIE